MDEVIKLGGRQWKVVDYAKRSLIHDHYIMRLMRQTGADKVAPMNGEGNAEYLIRLQTALIDSGHAHDLLAGYLLPIGKTEEDWTPKLAAQTALFIGKLNTEEDRDTANGMLMEVVFGFFRRGLDLLKTFQGSSSSEETSRRESPESLTPASV